MRTVSIPAISSRPVKVYEHKDILEMQKAREKLSHEITSLSALIEAKESPLWETLVRNSYDRLCEIERKRMFIPVDDIKAHSEIVGQWNERFLLTNELLNAKKRRYEKQSILDQLSKKVESVLNGLKKQQGETDG